MANEIKPEQVPEACLVAARALIREEGDVWMSRLIAAALNAWPGKDIVGYGPPFYGIDLILPLPTEASDD